MRLVFISSVIATTVLRITSAVKASTRDVISLVLDFCHECIEDINPISRIM